MSPHDAGPRKLSPRGGRQKLMHQPDRSDRSSDILVRRSGDTCGDRRPHRESGQATTEFALILLDVQMPGMDGFETAVQIKERSKTKDIPIIFITAISQEPHHALRGYSAGAVDYLFKPFDPWALRTKVGVFTELYRKTKMLDQHAELAGRIERAVASLKDALNGESGDSAHAAATELDELSKQLHN